MLLSLNTAAFTAMGYCPYHPSPPHTCHLLLVENSLCSIYIIPCLSRLMFEFKISKKSKKNNARLGILKTAHGEIETPAFVPVATQAAIKTLDSQEVLKTKSQILICNTFHLHLKPGEKIIK